VVAQSHIPPYGRDCSTIEIKLITDIPDQTLQPTGIMILSIYEYLISTLEKFEYGRPRYTLHRCQLVPKTH